MIKISKRTTEKISHFNCIFCKKWWTVGDASSKKKKWFCPWCGKENKIKWQRWQRLPLTFGSVV